MRRFILPALLLSCSATVFTSQAFADEVPDEDVCNWTGTWSSTYGELRLVHEGDAVKGDYAHVGTLEGKVGDNCGLKGKFTNFRQANDGSFVFKRTEDARFDGTWGWGDASGTTLWGGTRRSTETPELINQDMADKACDFTGTWSSTLGDLRMVQDDNSVTGVQRTANQIEGKTDECRLVGTIENAAADKVMDFSITKSDRRFTGTWSWQDSSSYQSYAWGGTLQDANIPVVPKPVDPVPTEPEPEEPEATDPVEYPKKIMTRTWRVNLNSVCALSVESYAEYQKIFGIAWIKARIIHKITNEEIEVAPVSGFPYLNNDKERAFEVQAKISDRMASLEKLRCASFSKGGFTRHKYSSFEMNHAEPIILDYTIDAARFGYDDIDDLLSNRNNRFRVMVKLGEYDFMSGNEELGTVARNTPMIEANFCGSCQIKKVIDQNEFHEDFRQGSLLGRPIGSGALSGFKADDEEAVVLYDIQPLSGD